MKRQLKLALVLFLLGFAGVLSLLWMEFPLPDETREILSYYFSDMQLKGLLLINPILFLIIGVTLGSLLYEKAGFTLPVFEAWLFRKKMPGLYPLFIIGLGGGLFAGLLITISHLIFQPGLPADFIELSFNFSPPLLTRILYGGITEEIMMRFGIMSFVVWLILQFTSSFQNVAYWIGIIVSALLFGTLHLPMMYVLVPDPGPTLIIYIVITNALGGLIFGWLYWKKGLAVAMFAHIVTHLVMVLAQV